MDSLVYIILAPLVAMITFLLGRINIIGVIRSSAMMGIVSYIFFPQGASILYGATFVGMSSKNNHSLRDVFISSLFYYLIVNLLSQWFKGIGGTLGMSAFLGVVLWQIMKRVSRNLKKKSSIRT